MQLSTINYKSKAKGFTLIELLVVIAIIAILAAIVMLVINPAEMMRKARDATRISDMGTVQKAIDLLVAQGDPIPNSGGARNSVTHGRDCGATCGAASGGWICGIDVCDHLPTLPIDPRDPDAQYQFNANGTNYEIRCQLESTDNDSKEVNDGGDDNTWYEVGTDLTLL